MVTLAKSRGGHPTDIFPSSQLEQIFLYRFNPRITMVLYDRPRYVTVQNWTGIQIDLAVIYEKASGGTHMSC